MVLVKFEKGVYFSENELKEVLKFFEVQNTTDRYRNIELIIRGNYADIIVNCDEDGDFKVEKLEQRKEKE